MFDIIVPLRKYCYRFRRTILYELNLVLSTNVMLCVSHIILSKLLSDIIFRSLRNWNVHGSGLRQGRKELPQTQTEPGSAGVDRQRRSDGR